MKRLDFLKSLIVAPAVAEALISTVPSATVEPSPPMPVWDEALRKALTDQMEYAARHPRFYLSNRIFSYDINGSRKTE